MSQPVVLNDHVQLLELTNELEAKSRAGRTTFSWEEPSLELEEFE